MVKSEHIALKADPDDPEDGDVTEAALAEAQAERQRRRGRPPGTGKPAEKERITIRLDHEVLSKFRATGPGWQSRINEVLKRAKVRA